MFQKMILFVFRSLALVTEETLKHFRESAENLIAERGAVESLAAALAVMSGSTKIVSRSLLCSREVNIFGIYLCYKNNLVQFYKIYKTYNPDFDIFLSQLYILQYPGVKEGFSQAIFCTAVLWNGGNIGLGSVELCIDALIA